MLKRLATIGILMAFTLQTFNNALTVLNYYTNTIAFAKNCVNKTSPQLHCQGKCQMVKKLKDEEKKEQQNSGKIRNSLNDVISSKSFFAGISVIIINTLHTYNSVYKDAFSIGIKPDIFHPPGLV